MPDPFDFEQPARYAVMGNPVAHSKSPTVHQLFARQFQHRIEYSAIQVDPGGFPQAVAQFRAAGGKGINVTLPFKLDAFRLADNVSDRAKAAGAVNTLKFESDDRIFGDNTDGTGMVHDIELNLQMPIKGKRILLLGAGGAARGALGPLLKHQPQRVVVANRTIAKARELVQAFDGPVPIEACTIADLRGKHFDIVINATSASVKGEVPELPPTLFTRDSLAYDMMYSDRPTPFLEWAALNGAARVSDGLGMLVEQAAESYFVWRGVRPETKPVLAALKKAG